MQTYDLVISSGLNIEVTGQLLDIFTVSTYPAEHQLTFRIDIQMGRAEQPVELAPAYVYLSSNESACVTSQFLHVNGGKIRYTQVTLQ